MGLRIPSIFYSFIHFIYGFIIPFTPPHIAYIMTFTFMSYELIEMFVIHDKAYKEIREFGAGLWTGTFIRLLTQLY